MIFFSIYDSRIDTFIKIAVVGVIWELKYPKNQHDDENTELRMANPRT